MAVNATSVWLGCKAVLAQMLKQDVNHPRGDRGWILNISSIVGLVGARVAREYSNALTPSIGQDMVFSGNFER
jgi:NAD(P)-dependent dehydrogenase (short-subunit alcohol dehydrogenase family)